MATSNPVVKLKHGLYSQLVNVPAIDGTIYVAQEASQSDTTAKADQSARTILAIDVANAQNTSVERILIDAYRAVYANLAGYADRASQWTSAPYFSIIDGASTPHSGQAIAVDGSATEYKLKLPSTIAANIIGNLTGTADKAKALVVTAAIGSTTLPVYIDANGKPQVVSKTTPLTVSITGNAGSADKWANKVPFYITDNTGGTGNYLGPATQVDGSDNSYTLKLPKVIRATLEGRATKATQLVAVSGSTETAYSVGGSADNTNYPVYFNNGIPVAFSGKLANNISGTADRALVAEAFATAAGSTTTPIYLNAQGVPTQVSGIDVSLLQGVIDISHLPKSVQERMFIISQTDTSTTNDADAIAAFITAHPDDVTEGDVIQVDETKKMYYIYNNNGTLEGRAFVAGSAASAQFAQSAAALDHTVTWRISDSASTPHQGAVSTASNLSGSNTIVLKLPTTITATLDGRADRATRLVNSSNTNYNVGGPSSQGATTYYPVYFANGIPVVITGKLANSISGNADTADKLSAGAEINGTMFDGSANITTAKWGTARNFTIKDADSTNAGTAVSVNGSANITLKLPATIKANLTGKATTAGTADKVAHAIAFAQYDVSGQSIGALNVSYDGSASAQVDIDIDTLMPKYVINNWKVTGSNLTAGSWKAVSGFAQVSATGGSTSVANLTTGTYIVQIKTAAGNSAGMKSVVFSGVMSYYGSNCDADSPLDTDEVMLHSSGANLSGHRIYLRVKYVANAMPVIEICSDANITTSDSFTFTFRKVLS